MPVVRFDPVECFTVDDYSITDVDTGENASEYIKVNMDLNLIIITASDSRLLGRHEYYLHALNAGGMQEYIDNFVINYVDSCMKTQLVEQEEISPMAVYVDSKTL